MTRAARSLNLLLVADRAEQVACVKAALEGVRTFRPVLTQVTEPPTACPSQGRLQTDLVLLEMDLARSMGEAAFLGLVNRAGSAPIVLLGSQDDLPDVQRWLALGAQDFVPLEHLGPVAMDRSVRCSLGRHAVGLALGETERMYRAMVESAGEGMGLVDLDDRFLFANRVAAELLGVPDGELVGRSLREFISEEQFQQVAARPNERREGESSRYVLSIVRPDGQARILQVTTTTQFDGFGQAVGTYGIFRDVTERHRHEEDLRHRIAFEDLLVQISSTFLSADEDNLDELLNAALAGIGSFADVDRAYIFCFNSDASTMSNSHEWCAEGVSPEMENLQELPTEIAPMWMDSLHRNRIVYIPRVSELTPEWAAEREILEPQGIQSLLVVPIHTGAVQMGFIGFDSVRHERSWTDADQLLLRFMADNMGLTLRNVEQQRRTRHASEEARRMAEAAEAANHTKSLFLANMSHEIRTPMNAILGFTQVLQRDPFLSPTQSGHLNTIARSGAHLLKLIDDVLDMSKIEAGRLVLRPGPVHLQDFLDDLMVTFQDRADTKGLKLDRELDPDLPIQVLADEGKLRQILVNLLGNAVKFTDRGAVTLRVRRDDAASPAEHLHLLIEVEDTGPGISPEDMQHLFSVFQQGESGARSGGTGLGLAISARLAERMGGGITVTSQPGQGSCFMCRVSLEESGEEGKPLGEGAQVLGLDPTCGKVRVLVVDDEGDNRLLLHELLHPMGFEVAEARNGSEALDIFNRWSPRAVLMDMRMPVMDGYEATRRLRESEAGRKAFIVAITASAFEGARRQVMATGVDAFLRKPFRQEELVALLGRGLGLRYLLAHPGNPQGVPRSSLIITAPPLVPLPGGLPEDMRKSMLDAVREGDMVCLKEHIDAFMDINQAGADSLLRMAERYDYDALEACLAAEVDPEA